MRLSYSVEIMQISSLTLVYKSINSYIYIDDHGLLSIGNWVLGSNEGDAHTHCIMVC